VQSASVSKKNQSAKNQSIERAVRRYRRVFMFSDRNPTLDIIYVGEDVAGQKLKSSINDGDSVVLKRLNENVLIRDVGTIYPGKFTGIIYGFDPSGATEFGGLKVDDIVNFSESHVLLCRGA